MIWKEGAAGAAGAAGTGTARFKRKMKKNT